MRTVPSTANAAGAKVSRIARPQVVNRDIESFSFSKNRFLRRPRRRAPPSPTTAKATSARAEGSGTDGPIAGVLRVLRKSVWLAAFIAQLTPLIPASELPTAVLAPVLGVVDQYAT